MASTTDTPLTEPAQAKVIVPPRKRRATRAYLLLGGLAVAVLAIYFIHGYLTKDEVSTDDAQIDADVVPLAARVGGVILRMEVEDHQMVKAGQLLAVIDPADYDKQVADARDELDAAGEQAEASDAQVQIVKSTSTGGLSSARAQLQGTSASVRAASSQVQAATAAVARAKSDLTKAEGDLTRAKTLHDQGAITGQALETAQALRDSAAAAYDLANANLNSARDQQQLSQTRVAEAQGHVEQSAPIDQQNAVAVANAKLAHTRVHKAQVALDSAKLYLGYTKIVAPVDGFVSKLAVHAGQMVQPGVTVAMVVPKQTYVVANFKETQISRIRAGDEVEIKVDAVAGTFHGKVASMAAGTGARFSMMPPDNSTGNFVKVVQRVPVKIVWTAQGDQDVTRLQAGLSAEVTVHLK